MGDLHPKISELRCCVFPRGDQNGEMDQRLEDERVTLRREALQRAVERLVAAGKITSLNDWCKKAGVGFNTPSDFLKGLTASMTARTYGKLGAVVGLTVAELMGEAPPVSAEDMRIITDLRALDPDERADLLDLLRRRAHSARFRRRPAG